MFENDIVSRKLKIAEFIDTFYPNIDGVVSVTDHYAKRLNLHDHCTVIAPKRKNYVDDLTYEVIRCKAFMVPLLKMDCGVPSIDIKLKKTLMAGNFDIFHVHSPFSLGRYALNMARKLDIPIIATFHTKYYDDFKKYLKLNILAKGALKAVVDFYEKVDEVWTVNNNMVETLREYGFKGKAIVMDNATEFDFPEDVDSLKDMVNQIYHIGKDELVFAFVGQLILQKNIELTISSAKLLKESGLKFKLFMVGTGFDEKYIKEYTKELGLEEDVIYTGRISDRKLLSAIYSRSTLLLFPSLYDASSIVLIEAAAHKLPGVLIEGATTAEKIVDGHNGFLSENDPERYSRKILDILKDEELVKKAGENAYLEIYRSWDGVIKRARERYHYIIKNYKGRPVTSYKKRHEWGKV